MFLIGHRVRQSGAGLKETVFILGCGLLSGTGLAATAQSCSSEPNFVWVEAASAITGSDKAERDLAYRISALYLAKTSGDARKEEAELRQQRWFDDEDPQQTVSFEGFCISKYQVTNAEYFNFVSATGHPEPAISEADYQKQGFLVHSYKEVVPYLWQGTKFPEGSANKPAVLASYDDATAFATWTSKVRGRSYRLPTAIEWEIAARGTGGHVFPWGNDWRDGVCNWQGAGVGTTTAAGAFPGCVSPFGLYDTVGNVFEYTLSDHGNGAKVLMKGCGWDDLPGFCRPAYQHYRPRMSRHILFGFRLVME